MEFTAGEEVERLNDDHQQLVLGRSDAAVEAHKKTSRQNQANINT